jgi:hypothetical protein
MIIQKYIHNRWACNYRENKFYQYRSEKCKLCPEKQHHIIQCPHCTKREYLRKEHGHNINKYFVNTETNPAPSRVLKHYIMSWINDKTPELLNNLMDDASPKLSQAVTDQMEIGWENFMKGRLSSKWSEMYNHNLLHKTKENKRMTAQKWGKDLIILLWNFVYECWTARSTVEHDLEGDPIAAQKEKIISHIKWLETNSDLCKRHSFYNRETY